MADLRLPKIADRTPVRISLSLDPELGQALAEYAELYEQSYGRAEPMAELIPAIVAAWLESDRAFARHRRRRRK